MSTFTQTDDSAIAISLFRDLGTGQWFVARMDFSCGNVMHQTRFKSATALEDTFCPRFVEMLRQYLPRRPDPTVLADSNVTFDLSKVVLKGIRVIATRVMDGYQTVVVRFARALGALTTLLVPQYRPDNAATIQPSLENTGDSSALTDNASIDIIDDPVPDRVPHRL